MLWLFDILFIQTWLLRSSLKKRGHLPSYLSESKKKILMRFSMFLKEGVYVILPRKRVRGLPGG